jgi:hypothetical protein
VSWRITLKVASGKQFAGLDNSGWLDAGFPCKGKHDRFVCDKVIENSGKETRLSCGSADVGWADAGAREKMAQPFGVGGDEPERLNRHSFGVPTVQL